MEKAFFIGFNALGDTLCTTPVLRAFRRAHPETFITYIVQNASFCHVLDGNPDIDLILYNEHMYLQGMTGYSQAWLHTLPLDLRGRSSVLYHFDIQQVCAKPEAFEEHIAQGFARLLAIPIDSVRPTVRVTEEEQRIARAFASPPYILFSMHSLSNPPRVDQRGRIKDWPEERWLWLAEQLRRDGFDVIAVGSERDRQLSSPLVRNLYGLPIKIVAALLAKAACVVTVDNGLAHLCHGLDASMVELYSAVVPRNWAWPACATHSRVLYGDPQEFSGEDVLSAVRAILAQGEV